MPQTVNSAFDKFLSETVNLDPEKTKKARASRDWLFGQIFSFQADDTFPKSYSDYDIHFGSFARRTKKRPLDDIDLMVCLSGQGGTYLDLSGKVTITVNPASNLKAFCHENSDTLNSIKVINKFIKKCADVPQYSEADLKRNDAAAVLSLQSYDWCFDIVPCFITAPEWDGRTYYLIPDGYGNWKKTDPRIDRERAIEINRKHSGNVLNVIRIIKYWNSRPTMPSIPSYLLETLILNYYASCLHTVSEYVDLEVPKVLDYLSTHIYYQVQDPKNIQGNINDLTQDEQRKISIRASTDRVKAEEARNLESNGDHKSSIQKWSELFGSAFPKYE